MATAVFKFNGGVGEGVTPGRDYPGFELGNLGGFHTINDEGRIINIGLGSSCWEMQSLKTDGLSWSREDMNKPEDEGEKGEVNGSEEGSGGHSAEGGPTAPAEEGDQAGGQAGKGGKGRKG